MILLVSCSWLGQNRLDPDTMAEGGGKQQDEAGVGEGKVREVGSR
jgi:hypothetical protein